MTSTPSARGPRGPYAKSRARRAEIVEAAIRVFGTRGYHAGSMHEIAREMGMSLTAVTHHFPDKAALVVAVLEETDRQADEWTATGGLVSWTLTLVERNLRRPELLRLLAILASEASATDHPAHRWFVNRYEHLRVVTANRVREDQNAGIIRPGRDAAFLADAINALWDGLQLQWLIDPSNDMLSRMRESLIALIPEAFEDDQRT